ncbi:TRAP transporter substrate-binding protein [Chelatococcus sp. GCM10030263]|uniref:TRAP transporter substrate-binding protein n=1 Tax=Chelatococcus sp. GCM10030263 TaxID=3273387 RepID=UPI00361BD732
MLISRRQMTFGLAATGLMAPMARASAQSQIKLTLAHNSAPSSPKGMGADKFAELVAAKSKGRITVHVAPSEQLGNENTNMAALRTGTLDFGALGQGALLSVAPEVSAIGLPFLVSTLPQAWSMLDGPIGQELAKRLEAKNVVFLSWWCNGIRQTSNNKRPIHTPEDFKGLKIRTPLDAATVDMFSAMGANPQQISWGEVYLALQSGVVDGQENPLANIYAAKLYEVQKYISFTNHKYEPTGLIMSTAAWRRLKDDDRVMVREAATEAAAFQRKAMADSEEKLMGEFKKMPSLTLNTVDTAPFRKATEVVWDNWEKKPFGDFVKQLRAMRAA